MTDHQHPTLTQAALMHTPTPWEVIPYDEDAPPEAPCICIQTIDDGDDAAHVAFCFGDDEGTADFIRRACNCHDDLLEALGRCRELFSDIRGDWSDPRADCREGWAIIDAAIAKAKRTEL